MAAALAPEAVVVAATVAAGVRVVEAAEASAIVIATAAGRVVVALEDAAATAGKNVTNEKRRGHPAPLLSFRQSGLVSAHDVRCSGENHRVLPRADACYAVPYLIQMVRESSENPHAMQSVRGAQRERHR